MKHAIIAPALLLVVALAATAADARVYKWNDPASGTTYFSGKPPTWYRSGTGGPRTYVFDEGRLVDDTEQTVSEWRRRQLRAEALRLARPPAEAEPQVLGLADLLGMEPEPEPSAGGDASFRAFEEDLATLLGAGAAATPAEPERAEPAAPTGPEATISRLKAVIEAWDRSQEQSAKALVE